MLARKKMMKSCDQCKSRKVRCSGASHPGATRCNNCARRNELCRFSALKRPRRRDHATPTTTGTTDTSIESDDATQHNETGLSNDLSSFEAVTPHYDGLQELYVDRLLLAPSDAQAPNNSSRLCLAGTSVFGNEYSITFFSERRLSALTEKLGHDRVSQARARAASFLSERMKLLDRVSVFQENSDRFDIDSDPDFVKACINSFFEQIHPMYNFIDQKAFESIAFGPHLAQRLAVDKSWAALFYAIVALGSQYHDGGSYQPAKNVDWRFFSASLALFPGLMITKATLTTVQAITAIAIFASNVSCVQLEYAMISEGTKKAQALGYDRCSAPGDDLRIRTFWVIYRLEKIMTFTKGRSSTVMDADISSAISPQPLTGLDMEPFDFSLASIRISRLLSRTYSSLYSVSVRGRPSEYYHGVIRRLASELEDWRGTIPSSMRPGHPIRPHLVPSKLAMNICVQLHCSYYLTLLHLNRASMQLEDHPKDDSEVVMNVMRTARSIIDLVQFIEIQPYTPSWILAAAPLSGFLVLFDLVVDHPTHPDTAANLILLDVGIGHFSRIEYASNGSLPGSILADFPSIARAYVREGRFSGHRANSAMLSPTLPTGAHDVAANLGSDTPSRPVSQSGTRLGSTAAPDLSASWFSDNTGEDLLAGTDILDLFSSCFPNLEEDVPLYNFTT